MRYIGNDSIAIWHSIHAYVVQAYVQQPIEWLVKHVHKNEEEEKER